MRRVAVWGAALVLGTALAVAPAGARSVAQPSALPDCAGKPVVRPASVVLTCADAGFTVHSLKWTGWGETFAAARGIESVNDCKPYCAAGHFHSYPVVIVAGGSQRCPSGVTAYANVTVSFLAKNPTIQAKPLSWPFRCR